MWSWGNWSAFPNFLLAKKIYILMRLVMLERLRLLPYRYAPSILCRVPGLAHVHGILDYCGLWAVGCRLETNFSHGVCLEFLLVVAMKMEFSSYAYHGGRG
jgi:hypothetical protein